MSQQPTPNSALRKTITIAALLGLWWITVSIPYVAAQEMSRSVSASCLLIGMNLMGSALVYTDAMGSFEQSRLITPSLALFLFYAAYGIVHN